MGSETGTKRRDISLCNVMGGGADIVFLPWCGIVFVGRDDFDIRGLVAIAVLSVYLAVLLAHNLERVLRGLDGERESNLAESILLCLVLVCMFGDGKGDPLVGYITLEDRIGFTMILIYIFYYSLRGALSNIISATASVNKSPVNPIIGGLMLASMRVHMTLDNAYTVAGAWMLGTRLLNKISSAIKDKNPVVLYLDLVLDSLLLSSLVFFGVLQYYNGGPFLSWLYVLQGVLAGLLAVSRLCLYGLKKQRLTFCFCFSEHGNEYVGTGFRYCRLLKHPPLHY